MGGGPTAAGGCPRAGCHREVGVNGFLSLYSVLRLEVNPAWERGKWTPLTGNTARPRNQFDLYPSALLWNAAVHDFTNVLRGRHRE